MDNSNQELDVQFVRFLVDNIVEHPEDIKIERTIDDLGVLINLQANKDDMGRIIGKNGQTIKSIRILLKIIGAKNNQKVNLKIIEPEE